MNLRLDGKEQKDFLEQLEAADIYSGPRGNLTKLRLSEKEMKDHEELVKTLLAASEKRSRE